MDSEKIMKCIQKAFQGVELGDGIGLREAQGIDEELDLDTLRKIRDNDEKRDWGRLTTETLIECETSLHFFNADGMRFHLPAYMLAELRGEGNHKILFHLTNVSHRGQGRFATLNIKQRRAVIRFLKWCLSNEAYQMQRKQIKTALDQKWSNAIAA